MITVPAKITFSGNRFAGKRFVKQAHTQIALLKEQMKPMARKQGRRLVTLQPGVTVEARICFGLESAHIHVNPMAAVEILQQREIEQVLAWYWYAVCVSVYPPEPGTGVITPINGGEGLVAVNVDQYGNVFVAGYSNTKHDFDNPDDELSNEAIIIKYDRDGTFLGRQVLVGGTDGSSVNKNESATGIAIDRTADPLLPLRGGIYLAADTYQDRFGVNYDSSLVKYAGNGTIKWQRRLTFTALENNLLFNWGVASDPAGNAITWGVINSYENESPYDFIEYAGFIASFAYDGSLNWQLRISDAEGAAIMNYAFIRSVASDPAGNLFVCGPIQTIEVGGLKPAGMVLKLSNNGVPIWQRALEGRFRQANGLYGWYGSGVDIEGCATDADGNVYCVSKTQLVLGTDTGFFHYHVTQVLADGTLGWQRFLELPYHSAASATISRVQIAVSGTAVFAVFPRHPNAAATPAEPWGCFIVRLHRSDSPDPLGYKAGDVAWQRLLTLDLPQPQFTSYSGVLVYSIKAAAGKLYLAASVLFDVSPLTIKLPAGGGFLGNKRGLVFTNPGLTIYDDPEDLPVRQDPGEGEGDPGYEFNLVSEFSMPVLPGPMSVLSPTDGDYTSPTWTQTNRILKKTNISVREVS